MPVKDIQQVIKYPLVSEDAVTLIEAENKIVFIVDADASKNDIRRAVEELYEVRVDHVNSVVTPEGRKKAYVKLAPDHKASDLAVRLGIL
jgi:large subunit ribosomal protein L23